MPIILRSRSYPILHQTKEGFHDLSAILPLVRCRQDLIPFWFLSQCSRSLHHADSHLQNEYISKPVTQEIVFKMQSQWAYSSLSMERQPSSFWCKFLTDSRQMCWWRCHWLLDLMLFLPLFFSALPYFPFSFFGKFFAGEFICAHGFTTYPLVDEFLFQLWTFSHGPNLNVQHRTKHFFPRVAQRPQTRQTPNSLSASLCCLVPGAATVGLHTQPSQSQPWLWLFRAPASIRRPLSVDAYLFLPGINTFLAHTPCSGDPSPEMIVLVVAYG